MKKQKRPYGSWPSPVSPALVGGKNLRFGHFQAGGDDLYWLEGRPNEAGRVALMKKTSSGEVMELTPPDVSVKTKVHEYGGADFLVCGADIFFVNGSDQDIYRITGKDITRMTHAPNLRFADLFFEAGRNRILAVCEDHGTGAVLPENRIVQISLEGEAGRIETLVEGADFYTSPAISPCGTTLSYLSWSLPYMPWEAAALCLTSLDEAGLPTADPKLIGGVDRPVFQPLWNGPDVYFVIEHDNWNNIARARRDTDFGDVDIVWPLAADFGRPHWVFGQRSFAFLAQTDLIASYFDEGENKLARYDLNSRNAEAYQTPFKSFDMIAVTSDQIAGLVATDEMAPAFIGFGKEARPDSFAIIRASSEDTLPAADISKGQLIHFPTRNGDKAYALYYPPQNSEFVGMDGELPPMIVSAHGGPTGMADRGLKLKIQYWTSRGFAFLDVDYRGSSGYGKAYREALNGAWGVLDVCDVVDGAKYCADQGFADKERLVISGTSAGGLTVLNALIHHRIFRAGACYYGVSDLKGLCEQTHKFEADYIYRLTNTDKHSAKTKFRGISPKNHIAGISAPIILFQGELDPVVPPAQSRAIYAELKKAGHIVSYNEFEGEGHGFRKETSLITALSREYLFYAHILGFEASFGDSPVPELAIENL